MKPIFILQNMHRHCAVVFLTMMLMVTGLCASAYSQTPALTGKLAGKATGGVNAPKVTLTINKSIQDLTETAVLNSTVTYYSLGPYPQVTNYNFEIKRTTSKNWYSLRSGSNSSFNWVRRVAGQFHLRVTVTIGKATYKSANIYAVTQFPEYSTIVADATVSNAMNTAWTNTKNATTATTRREGGFWVRLNTDGTGTYSVVGNVTGPVVGNTTGADIALGNRPVDTPLGPAANSSGVGYTVASFHTHTPMTYRTGSRKVGASGADSSVDTTDNVTGIVYDYVDSPKGTGYIPGGHPLNSAATLYPSGPNRRSTP